MQREHWFIKTNGGDASVLCPIFLDSKAVRYYGVFNCTASNNSVSQILPQVSINYSKFIKT